MKRSVAGVKPLSKYTAPWKATPRISIINDIATPRLGSWDDNFRKHTCDFRWSFTTMTDQMYKARKVWFEASQSNLVPRVSLLSAPKRVPGKRKSTQQPKFWTLQKTAPLESEGNHSPRRASKQLAMAWLRSSSKHKSGLKWLIKKKG